ncbi:MAG: sodium:proton antiporter [Syntrophorhabdales bacterium]
MDLFDIITVLITLSALFSYLNYRYLHLPRVIGLLLFGLVLSFGIVAAGFFHPAIKQSAAELVGRVDFNRLLLRGMLGFLLFAGPLRLGMESMLREKWVILSLSTLGVLLSTAIVTALTWAIFALLGNPVPAIYCLLFGALISPTDPIAVLAIMQKLHAPEALQTVMAGESLFNDGIGVVIFIVLLQVASGGGSASLGGVIILFLKEAVGGVLFGTIIGYAAYRLIRSVDNYQVEVLLTLALAMGGYSLANALQLSGPLAVVVAGLLIGNHGRHGMSERTKLHLDSFWELIDEILNAILFVLIGLELLSFTFARLYLLVALLAIPVVLLARIVSVAAPIALIRHHRFLAPHTIKILTWGGLRGGLAVALALSLPAVPEKNVLLVMTYVVVIFSIVFQGLTIERLIARWTGR